VEEASAVVVLVADTLEAAEAEASMVVVLSMEEVSAVVVLVADTLEAAEAEASMVVVVVSMEEVSAVAVSTAVAFVVAVAAISVQCEADTCSPTAGLVRGVAATGVAAIGAAIGAITITDSLMMSSSATSAFRGGGAIRTDITVTTITRTMTMGTAGTVTTMTPVIDTAMAADQGICGVGGVGDKHGLRLLEFALLLVRLDHAARFALSKMRITASCERL
jgi:hypothetical protein